MTILLEDVLGKEQLSPAKERMIGDYIFLLNKFGLGSKEETRYYNKSILIDDAMEFWLKKARMAKYLYDTGQLL